MMYLGTNPISGQLKSKLFTTSGTFVVPADVYLIYVDGCGSGGGGGGGDATPGGGGGGGTAGRAVKMHPFPVIPGDTLTITIGAGGVGGAVGSVGVNGGTTNLVGALLPLQGVDLGAGVGGTAASGTTGGNGGTWGIVTAAAGGATGVAGTSVGTPEYLPAGNYAPSHLGSHFGTCKGAGGGGLNANGGIMVGPGTRYIPPATGGASGGGGGAGGSTPFGLGGAGGSNGAAGSNGTGYGTGGGGGSGNSAGGNGAPGFIQLFMITGYTI